MSNIRRRYLVPLVLCASLSFFPALAVEMPKYEVTDVSVLEADPVAAAEVFRQLGRRERPKKLDPKRARSILLAVTLQSTSAPKEGATAGPMQLENVDLRDFLVRDPAVEKETFTCVGMRIPFEPDDLWTFGWEGIMLTIDTASTYQFLFLIPAETTSLEFLQRLPGGEIRSVKTDLEVP